MCDDYPLIASYTIFALKLLSQVITGSDAINLTFDNFRSPI